MHNPRTNDSLKNEPSEHELTDTIGRLLSDVVLPSLQTVHARQLDQIAANDRLEKVIEKLRLYLESQFADLTAQLTACRAEVAILRAALDAVQQGSHPHRTSSLIH